MSNLCDKQTDSNNVYREFLANDNILVVTLPSKFLSIVQKYNRKNSNISFRLLIDISTLRNINVNAVLIDDDVPEYYEFAKDIKRRFDGINKKVKFYILKNNKYITDLKVNLKHK